MDKKIMCKEDNYTKNVPKPIFKVTLMKYHGYISISWKVLPPVAAA